VRELLAGPGWQADAVVTAVPGVAAASHLVSLPFSDARRIEQTVQFEVEAAIPFDLADVAWDWQPLERQDGRSDLLVGVIRNEELAALLASRSGGRRPLHRRARGPDPRRAVAAGAVADPAPAGRPSWPSTSGGIGRAPAWCRRGAASSPAPSPAARARSCAPCRGSSAWARATPRPSPRRRLAHRAPDRAGPGSRARLAGARAPRHAARLRGPAVPAPVRRIVLAAAPPASRGWRRPSPRSSRFRWSRSGCRGRRRRIEPDAPRAGAPLALALRGWLAAASSGSTSAAARSRAAGAPRTPASAWSGCRCYAGLVLLLALVAAGVQAVALPPPGGAARPLAVRGHREGRRTLLRRLLRRRVVLRGRGTLAGAIPRVSASGVLAELAARTPSVPAAIRPIEIGREKLTSRARPTPRRTWTGSCRPARLPLLRRSALRGPAGAGSEAKFEFTIDADITCEGAPAPEGKGSHGASAGSGPAGGVLLPPFAARAGDGLGGPRGGGRLRAVPRRDRISRSLSARTARIADKTQMLSQLGKLTAGYRQAQAERQALEARLKGPPVQLMSYVSQAGPRSASR